MESPVIVFVCPPSSVVTSFQPHLGAAYITAFLASRGIPASQYVTTRSVSIDSCAREILEKRPRIVGLTAYETNAVQGMALAEAIKTRDASVAVILGGPTPSVHARVVLEANPFVDLCVRHEGEETTLDVIERLAAAGFRLGSAGLDAVKGISFRRGGAVVESADRDSIGEAAAGREAAARRDILDRFPSPYLAGVLTQTDAGMITARGCNQSCVYCNCSMLSKRRIATHSVDRVVEELACLSRLTRREVQIYDDAFTLLPKRALEICRRVIEGKIRIDLNCITRCDMVNEELLSAMKEAGFRGIGFSLESAVPRVLRAIGKVQPPDAARDDGFEREKAFIDAFKTNVRLAKKIGIPRVYVSIMVGLPGESPEDAEETVNVIRSLGSDVDIYMHNVLRIFEGTPLHSTHRKHGYRVVPYRTGIHSRTIHPFDPALIPMTSRAGQAMENSREHLAACRALSGAMSWRESPGFFGRIVLEAERIEEHTIRWLRECLSIHGVFVLLYASREAARANHEANVESLLVGRSPSTFPLAYYAAPLPKGGIAYHPVKVHRFQEQHCRPFFLAPASALRRGNGLPASSHQCVFVENGGDDTRSVVEVLHDLARSFESGGSLLSRPVAPFCANLCRWDAGPPNCRVLETALVDRNGNIRACWNGDVIGRVGASVSGMLSGLDGLRRSVEASRGCGRCASKDGCSVCLFPGGLTVGDFCRVQGTPGVRKAATVLRALDNFKEAAIRPDDGAAPE